MNERVKTIVFAVASLAMLGAFLWVIAQYQGAWAEEEEEPISEPVIAEPTVDTSEDETMPETALEEPEQAYYEPEPYQEPTYCEQTGGLTASGGVYYYNGRKETWYSSNVLYHYRTPEWWLDEEGCWRTEEGYYVVASNDYEEGTLVEMSKGTAQVLDCGCASGTLDVYTAW